jgi:hypothetical protein
MSGLSMRRKTIALNGKALIRSCQSQRLSPNGSTSRESRGGASRIDNAPQMLAGVGR